MRHAKYIVFNLRAVIAQQRCQSLKNYRTGTASSSSDKPRISSPAFFVDQWKHCCCVQAESTVNTQVVSFIYGLLYQFSSTQRTHT